MTTPATVGTDADSAVDLDAPAVLEPERTFTRRELDAAANQLARRLQAMGVREGDRLAWTMANRSEVFAVAWAAQRLGAVLVPLSYRSSEAELRRLLAVARPAAVVVEGSTRRAIESSGGFVFDVDDPAHVKDWQGASAAPVTPPPTSPNRLGAGASMLFTSGTTGVPKAALRIRGDRTLAERVGDAFGFGSSSHHLAAGPLYHSGPWTCAMMTLSRGGVVSLLRKFDPRAWLDIALAHGVTGTFITATQLRKVVEAVEAGRPAPPSLAGVVVSGEPFPPELKRRAVAALGPCLVECYGCTELGPLTYVPADRLLERPSSSGMPFPGVEVAAFDGDRRLPPGMVGILRARTPLAFEGYVRSPDAATDGGGDEWATVGDMGLVDEEGWVHLAGREDDMIITGGVNVFPADVEAVVAEHPAVRQCAVFGLPDDRWGSVVCVAVVADPGADLEVHDLRTWLRHRIADDKRPHRLFRVAELPTTATGKISRKLVRERFLPAAGVPA
ncbi:MAG: AMP-binding protein [Actinobacteria bacterium]|nr:AMP-binding protein [Actinomycetota bacterium]